MRNLPCRYRVALRLGLALPLASACSSNPTGSSDALLTAGGSLVNPSGKPVPANARVVVGWVVSSTGSDYTYLFGEGTLVGDRFSVTFRQPPPVAALNSGQLGVGVVLLTADPAIRSGVHLEDVLVDPAQLLGATGRFASAGRAHDHGADRRRSGQHRVRELDLTGRDWGSDGSTARRRRHPPPRRCAAPSWRSS